MICDVMEALVKLLAAKEVLTSHERDYLVSAIGPYSGPEEFTARALMLAEAISQPVFEMLIPEGEWGGRVPEPPSCETEESAGYDLRAFTLEPVTIFPGDTKVIRTGWSVWMPVGVECQVRSRSGLAAKYGVSVLNSPGTVEPDYYPNDIKVILHNGGPEPFVVNHGDRIAQVVFARFIKAANGVQKDTIRDGGLGHTGR